MDKKFVIYLKNINEDYRDDIDGNLQALLESVDFSEDMDIEELI